MKKILFNTMLIVFVITASTYAQWANEWSSNSYSSAYAVGWVGFEKNGSEWLNRFFVVDESTFKIFSDQYSTTAEFIYTFSAEEIAAGNQIYSLVADLTGDNITEFYVLSSYGSAEPYRQSFKIIDITKGTTIFEMNDADKYFTYPVVWDVDNDGILECTFAVYDYPNFSSYSYEAYNTGVLTSANQESPSLVTFNLEQNYPNPFNPSTTIQYSVDKPSQVKISIFDINGRLVKNLVNSFKNAGSYSVVWDGYNQSGGKVASGTYFYRMSYDGKNMVKRMILLK